MSERQSADYVAERSCLFRIVVPLGGDEYTATTESTQWFDQPKEGRLVHVEWDREVAVLTYMVTRYPEQSDGEVGT